MVADDIFTLVLQIWVFAFGCCMGSFYNVIIYRLPREESIVSPASKCPGCGEPIAFYDNIPIVSFLFLRGKCRKCGTSISFRYPLVELATGLLALALFRLYGFGPQFFVEFVFLSMLLIISLIDFDTYMIPDVLSLSGIVLGFAFSFITPRLTWVDSLLGILIGGGLLYGVATVYGLLRKKEAMGGGDIKLIGMIGAFIGWQGVVFTIMVSAFSGTIIAIPVLLRKNGGFGSQIPYGPFLAFGAAVYIFWGQILWKWYLSEILGI